ncbi:MAG: hypothetical protein K1Y36_21675 [Blastocatellia bacterium]|nr:hypothetical protein [Blastocatellia bacterium]
MEIGPKQHEWSATGVSGYPLAHPIVGQSEFFDTFKQFIHTVDRESERFAHVFAIIAQWGVGKSRLAYEIISQINDTSPGWYLRGNDGVLANAQIFHNDADREQYLGLYIRYSQIANEYHNVDNWFAFGMYKALVPLARGEFVGSIQGAIAQEAYNRLLVGGFQKEKLAEALELSKSHPDQRLYEDENLVTRLCTQAYDYLKKFGIKYLLIALDELETVAESATYGLETDEIKHLDGRAIKLLGKAIKEEDPRQKLPWLRYVALCSPAIGDELREIQSVARRFELVELTQSVFADVSDFVKYLTDHGKLRESYPAGLVEAAYMMSRGNFGWFNVIMANVDTVLQNRRMTQVSQKDKAKETTVEAIFEDMLRSSSRIREHVLDRNAVEELKIQQPDHLQAARKLLYGQLPQNLKDWPHETVKVLSATRNEYDEPLAALYVRVEWEESRCSDALRKGRFVRDREVWTLQGIDQPLYLKQLLANLATYAIHEMATERLGPGKRVFLVPLSATEFVQLVQLLYPHPAAEDAARALWREFFQESNLEPSLATHLGPSIPMLGRFNLRYRKQSQNTLIFRTPEHNSALEKYVADKKQESSEGRIRRVLTGLMRLLDSNWSYDPEILKVSGWTALGASPAKGQGATGGLINCDALKLNPKGRLILGWVKNEDELESFCTFVTQQFDSYGRIPAVAFTTSRVLVDRFQSPASGLLKNAKSYLTLYQLSAGEEYLLHLIGIPSSEFSGFGFDGQGFTGAFNTRLNALLRSLMDHLHQWRRQLNEMGRIAWPLRATGKLSDEDKEKVFKAWRSLLIEPETPQNISRLDEKSPVNPEELQAILKKMGLPKTAPAAGYQDTERARLFDPLDDTAEPEFPQFLAQLIMYLLTGKAWKLDLAEREWFWGYTWEGAKPKEIFTEWMALICEMGFAYREPASTEGLYRFKDRAELKRGITEAENWLNGEYLKIIHKIEAVFGEGRIQSLFSSGQLNPGTKTLLARSALDRANQKYQELVALEEAQYPNSLDDENRRSLLIQASRCRLSLLNEVEAVYLKDEFERLQSDANLKTLNFEDDTVPLWKRVRRAKLFVDLVRDTETRIKSRIQVLQDYMRQSETVAHFPYAIFTRSLEKISNILDGALSNDSLDGSTKRKQHTEPGTLGHALKDLNVAEATNKLTQLAREVGITLHSQTETPFENIEGDIVRGFLALKKSYEGMNSQLEDARQRIANLIVQLEDAPSDFVYPPDTLNLKDLVNRPEIIEGILEDAREDEVERLFKENDNAAKLGNFKPLMQAVPSLLTEAKNALGVLWGHIQTVENYVKDYRKKLVEAGDVKEIERSFNALQGILGQPLRKELDVAELIQAGSLKSAVARLEERRVEWVQAGNQTLSGTGIDFARWQVIVSDLDLGRDPFPTGTERESEALVKGGFLKRTYKLGGPQ